MKTTETTTTWNGITIKANTNCRTLGNIKWLLIQETSCLQGWKRGFTQKLLNELNRAGISHNAASGELRMEIWFVDNAGKMEVLNILKSQLSGTFEVCEIYDRQFGMGLNYHSADDVTIKPDNYFMTWEKGGAITLYPTTIKQNINAIRIN